MRIIFQIASVFTLVAFTTNAQAMLCPSDFHSDAEMVAFVKKTATNSDTDNLDIQTKDIDGDGRDDRLIGVGCGNGGCGYYVFLQKNPGVFHYVGNAGFHKDGFKYFPEKGDTFGILAYWHMSAGTGNLIRHHGAGCEINQIAITSGTSQLWDFVKDVPEPPN